ncbi:hypothetical protein [Sandaracinus amylolyticus]|uniref:Lipoprotein n=1 Tax=Sandaracinus amylolyticus TaxID=927083 RepID=A0A0F6YJ50_9BACT|nr:hypothetical protein [Sandaracinus amylolyticus]AKF06572.1 hypothetical protein DB32_003721 [Sandaracinus amylolyticus]
MRVLFVLLALGMLTMLPGCPFFTRADREASSPSPAAAHPEHPGH